MGDGGGGDGEVLERVARVGGGVLGELDYLVGVLGREVYVKLDVLTVLLLFADRIKFLYFFPWNYFWRL